MPYFFVRREGPRAVVEGADAQHLVRSLRVRMGEEFDALDQAAGTVLRVRVDAVSRDRVEGAIVAEHPHHPEPSARITLAVANLPAPALELVLSRCTEAGAHAFCVFQAERSVGRGDKPERWGAICREASMLAGRFHVPAVRTADSLADVLRAATQSAVVLDRSAPRRLASLTRPQDVTLVIGPEGGWTPDELALAAESATLGPRNMRAGTAALVALAVALAVREGSASA